MDYIKNINSALYILNIKNFELNAYKTLLLVQLASRLVGFLEMGSLICINVFYHVTSYSAVYFELVCRTKGNIRYAAIHLVCSETSGEIGPLPLSV